MAARSAPKKKGHPKFNIPNYGTKGRSRVPARWRKQRGIDNKKRIKRAHMGAEPTIGYRNPETIRGVRANGKRAVLVHNIAEFRNAVSNEESVDVILASTLSRKKRLEINKMALENKIHIANLGRATKRPEAEAKSTEKAKAAQSAKPTAPAAPQAAQTAPSGAPAQAGHTEKHEHEGEKPKGATSGV